MKNKLSSAQFLAYFRLSPIHWRSSYELGVSKATLDALVRKGYAESRGYGTLGSSFSPRTTIKYLAKNIPTEAK